jgi:simple sugar transport system ATP-binding protein
MSDAQPPIVETVGVSKRFGATQALRDVSIAIDPGESRALVGRNGAGKSTLVAILTGLLRLDAGEVRFQGESAPDASARELWREQVACVYQKSTVIPTLTVGENLFLNAYPGQRRGLVSWKALRRQGRQVLDEWGIDVDVDMKASELTVGQRQLTEIARSLRLGSRFIILDEPTARLEAAEIEELFDHMRRLRAAGITFLYISHHLDEIYEVCESVTVVRDGEVVATGAVADLGKDAVVRAMVGGEEMALGGPPVGEPGTAAVRPAGTTVLSVRDLSVEGWCGDVSFEVRAGELVGLAGLAGSGKVQVADAIAGIVRSDGGEVAVGGRAVPSGRVDRAIAEGIGYLPGDRHARGFSPNLAVDENMTMTIRGHLGAFGLVDSRVRDRRARELIEGLEIVVSTPRQPTAELSGGNQQKSVLGRALASKPRALVLVSPTAGVDIASKKVLLEAILRSEDVGVLIVSDELDELAICDRVLVMFAGRITRKFGRARDDRELVAAIEGVGADA